MSAAAEVEPLVDDFGLILWPNKTVAELDEVQEAYDDGYDVGYNAACHDRRRLW